MIKLILPILFLTVSSYAGILGSKPPTSFKSKLMTIPMFNGGKPIDISVDELEKYGFREDAKLSWDNEGKSAWIFEIKVKDKMKGSTDTIKLRFQDEPSTARLDRIVINGKEENVNYSPQLLGGILIGVEQKRGPSKRIPPAPQATEPTPAVVTNDSSSADKNDKKIKDLAAAETLRRNKADQAKVLKENNEKDRKAITAITALAGKYCGSNGTKIEISDDGKSSVILSVSENMCSMSKKSLPVLRYTEGSDTIEIKLADSNDPYRNCTMTIRPTTDSGKKSVGLGIDCDDNIAKQTLGCDYGNLITTYEPCP